MTLENTPQGRAQRNLAVVSGVTYFTQGKEKKKANILRETKVPNTVGTKNFRGLKRGKNVYLRQTTKQKYANFKKRKTVQLPTRTWKKNDRQIVHFRLGWKPG